MQKHISHIKKTIITTIIINILICALFTITISILYIMIIELRIFSFDEINFPFKMLIFIISALLVILCVKISFKQIKRNTTDLILLQKCVYDVIEVVAIKNNYSIDISERFVLVINPQNLEQMIIFPKFRSRIHKGDRFIIIRTKITKRTKVIQHIRD